MVHTMGTLSLADLGKTRKLHQGLPSQEERVKFKQEVVLGRDGVYLSYLSDFFDIVYRAESFDERTEELLEGVGVPEVEPGLTIAETIPSGMIYRMVAWYRHVNELYGTEATMQVFYDKSGGTKDFPQELKDTYQGAIKRDGNFVYVVPVQNVTGGHVTFDGDQFPSQLTKELYEWAIANYEPVLNIHSHNSMSAFWSGEDDANELPLYTRLCLVIGKVNTNHPEFRFSWNFEGKRHHYEHKIDTFIEPLEMVTSIKGLGYESKEELGFKDALGFVDFDELEFDEHWDEQIKARGRGLDSNKFFTLNELGTKKYNMTREEITKVKDLAVNGDYEDGVEPDLTTLDALDALDNTVIGLEDMPEEKLDTDYLEELEDWKKDLLSVKGNLHGHEAEGGVVNGTGTFRNESEGRIANPNEKSQKIFDKFKKDELKKEKHNNRIEDGYGQGGIWDDFGGKY